MKDIHPKTSVIWLNHLGFKFQATKKSYYTDRHEDEENVESRKIFINRYMTMEFRSFHWVQVTEEVSIRMENENTNPLGPHTYYSYRDSNKGYE